MALVAQPKTQTVRAGIKLLEQVIAEFPGHHDDVAGAQNARAEGLWKIGEIEMSVEAYREAIEYEKRDELRNIYYTTGLDFVYRVALAERDECYDECLEVLAWVHERQGRFPWFHREKFMLTSATAVFMAHFGMRDDAARLARVALDAASATHSGLSHHPNVGLVTGSAEDQEMIKRMRRLGSV
ncbi:MAG: hypothetical protein RIB60_10905 [Phycisphaerales bacterium]